MDGRDEDKTERRTNKSTTRGTESERKEEKNHRALSSHSISCFYFFQSLNSSHSVSSLPQNTHTPSPSPLHLLQHPLLLPRAEHIPADTPNTPLLVVVIALRIPSPTPPPAALPPAPLPPRITTTPTAPCPTASPSPVAIDLGRGAAGGPGRQGVVAEGADDGVDVGGRARRNGEDLVEAVLFCVFDWSCECVRGCRRKERQEAHTTPSKNAPTALRSPGWPAAASRAPTRAWAARPPPRPAGARARLWLCFVYVV